jgi:hypothetical protein
MEISRRIPAGGRTGGKAVRAIQKPFESQKDLDYGFRRRGKRKGAAVGPKPEAGFPAAGCRGGQ